MLLMYEKNTSLYQYDKANFSKILTLFFLIFTTMEYLTD